MSIYIVFGLLIFAILAYFLLKKKPNSELDNMFYSTQSESKERVRKLNLDKHSEDVSYILDTNKLSFPIIQKETEHLEYKADPEREFIINLIPTGSELFKKSDFNKIFDYDWKTKYSSTIFGFSPEENRWTYANAGGSPEIYSKLQVAIDILEVFNEESPNFDSQKLRRYVVELEKRIKKYPTKLKIEQLETIEISVSKAKKLVQIYQEFNQYAIIVLEAENQFNGIEMWDVLQSLGLQWGNGDLFYWYNEHRYGHDQHFTVWTRTDPGYFLPEAVKDGRMNPQNLIFGFSIPRSADPKNIYEIMLNSVKYCQKRLGGQILDMNGQPLNEEKEKQELLKFLQRMEQKDLKAGSDKALRMF